MNEQKRRISLVLRRLQDKVENDEIDPGALCDGLDGMLDHMSEDDEFGSEAQNDPRGDMRDGDWWMGRVQGLDD